jgi:ABC-type transporter Mla maintaining outer membrane lipid asymmetry ATPase subunit MlaF
VRDIFRLTMLLVEHDMQLVLSVADYLYVLNFGKLLAQGEPTAVVNDPAVVAAYLGGDTNNPAEARPAVAQAPSQDTHRSAGPIGGGWQR